jgi:hypothetical protein
MKHFLLICTTITLLVACKDKDPIPYSELTPAERFEYLQIGCSSGTTQNYFTGTLDGEDFCRYESDKDTFGTRFAFQLVSSEPSTAGATPMAIIGGFRIAPAIPKQSGEFIMDFDFYDTAYVGELTLVDFIKTHYQKGKEFGFTSTGLDPFNMSNYSGIRISFNILDRITIPYLGNLYTTDYIKQPSSSYVKCTKMIESEKTIELEFDVNVVIYTSSYDKLYSKPLRGTFHYLVNK